MAYSIIETVRQKHESLHELNWKARGYCVINRSWEGDWGITFSITPIQSRKLSLKFFFSLYVLPLSFSERHSLCSDIDSFFISYANINQLNHEAKFIIMSSFKGAYNCQEFMVVQGLCFYRLLQRLKVRSNTNSPFTRLSLVVTMK